MPYCGGWIPLYMGLTQTMRKTLTGFTPTNPPYFRINITEIFISSASFANCYLEGSLYRLANETATSYFNSCASERSANCSACNSTGCSVDCFTKSSRGCSNNFSADRSTKFTTGYLTSCPIGSTSAIHYSQ